MRRNSKKRNSALKVLTAATVVAALSTGSLTAFASSDREIMVDTGNGVRRFNLDDLSNPVYRQIIIDAFNNASPILVEQEDGTWNEVSENATVEGIEDALEDYEAKMEEDSVFAIYFE